jgi:hypothetical protein
LLLFDSGLHQVSPALKGAYQNRQTHPTHSGVFGQLFLPASQLDKSGLQFSQSL